MDWIKLSWGDGDQYQYSDKIAFTIDTSGVVATQKTALEEAIDLVHQIAETKPKPYYLMCSGGIDSQAMLYSWKCSGVPFIPVTFRYNRDYNVHDLHNLWVYSQSLGISPRTLDIDIFEFLHGERVDYAKKYICNSPQITAYMKFVDIIDDGTCIFSGNFLNLHGAAKSRGGGIDYTVLGLYRYSLLSGKSVIPFFLCWTPTLQWAFSHTYRYKTWDQMEKLGIENYGVKTLNYLLSDFKVIPTIKFSGFERYKDYYDQFKDKFGWNKLALRYAKYPSKRLFDLLFRYPLFEINKYSIHTSWVFPSI